MSISFAVIFSFSSTVITVHCIHTHASHTFLAPFFQALTIPRVTERKLSCFLALRPFTDWADMVREGFKMFCVRLCLFFLPLVILAPLLRYLSHVRHTHPSHFQPLPGHESRGDRGQRPVPGLVVGEHRARPGTFFYFLFCCCVKEHIPVLLTTIFTTRPSSSCRRFWMSARQSQPTSPRPSRSVILLSSLKFHEDLTILFFHPSFLFFFDCLILIGTYL